MSNTLAGTDYPAPTIHILIEIGDGSAKNTTQWSKLLNLEVSTVVQIISDLIDDGEIQEISSGHHEGGNTDALMLTPKGYQSLTKTDTFTRAEVLKVLNRIPSRDAKTILEGLQTYATSLYGKAENFSQGVQIVQGYQPGLLARTLQMFTEHDSRTYGFGPLFQYRCTNSLSDLIPRLKNTQNEVWTAVLEGKIVGTLYVDGEELGSNIARLRVFVVDGDIRGCGIGRRLLAKAIAFTEEQRFDETRLRTFQGMDAARHLYESYGFTLKEETKGTKWGKSVVEQIFMRKTGVGKSTTKPTPARE